MGADLAAVVCQKFFSSRRTPPCHYGTIPVMDQTADKFVEAIGGSGVVVPERGRAVEV